jgi:hypothetical protein
VHFIAAPIARVLQAPPLQYPVDEQSVSSAHDVLHAPFAQR